MVFRHISNDMKARALVLWQMGWHTDEVCEFLAVSKSSLYRWGNDDCTPLNSFVSTGRPRILNDEVTASLAVYINRNAWDYLDEIQDWLAYTHDIKISRSALAQNIADAGYTHKVLRRKAIQQNPDALAAFRAFQETYLTADMCVCVDESSKDDRVLYRHYGRARSGQRAVVHVDISRGDKYSLLPAMCTSGYLTKRIIKGSVDGEEFFDFIIRDVLPLMNPFPQARSVLIMDNCAIHKTEELKAAVAARGILLVFIPAYSPECNPIEESFSAVKSWLRRNYGRFKDSDYPAVDLLEACETITPEKAVAFFRNSGYKV